MQLFLLFQLVICVWGGNWGERSSHFLRDGFFSVFWPCQCFALIAGGGWRVPPWALQNEPEPVLLRGPGPAPGLKACTSSSWRRERLHSLFSNFIFSLLLSPPSARDSVADSGGILKPKVYFHKQSPDIYLIENPRYRKERQRQKQDGERKKQLWGKERKGRVWNDL